MTQSALLVPVPAVESVVGEWRARYDSSAPDGIPAHVTVLYPFMAPAAIDASVLDALGACVVGVSAFSCTFSRVGWFGDEVVYLAPDDPSPFVALTEAVVAAFPDYPPYEGAFDTVVPHLTLGDTGTRAERAAIADAVGAHLPLVAACDAVWLMTGTPGEPWSLAAQWPLG